MGDSDDNFASAGSDEEYGLTKLKKTHDKKFGQETK